MLTEQSRTRARDPSVERNEGSGIIKIGSQKSWLILTAHVLQIFDTFRNKLANIKGYSVGILPMENYYASNGLEVALLTRSDRQRMVY